MAVSQEKPVKANKQCQIKQKKGKNRKNKPPSNEEENPAVNRKETCAVIESIPSGKSVKKFSGKSVKKPSGKSVKKLSGKSVKKKRAVPKKENVSEQGDVTDKVLNGVEGDLVDNLGQNETADDPPRMKKKKTGENKGTHSENEGEEELVISTSVIDQALETESAEAGQNSPTQERKKNKGNNPGTNLDDTKTVCINGDDANVKNKVYKRKRVVENGKAKKKRKIKGNGAISIVKESVNAKADSDKSTGGTQNDDKVGPHEKNNDEPETKKRKKMKLKIKRTDKENDELIKKSDESEDVVETCQLEPATFEDQESQKKYTRLKLLGGNKKGSDKKKLGKKLKVKKSDQSSDKQAEDEEAPPAKLAMSKIQERLLTIALESPEGLGFGNEGGNGNTYRKKFNFDFKDQDSFIKISHGDGILMIDPTVSKSIKFSDDD